MGDYKDARKKGNPAPTEDPNTTENPSPTENPAYEAAKELAESYSFLLKDRDYYKGKLGKYPRYTLDDAYYLLTQGAHEQTERVQTSGTSDPVSRAVMNADKLLHRLNAEMEAEYQREVVEPYQRTCAQIELFEISLRSLDRELYHIAIQLYMENTPKCKVKGLDGRELTRRKADRAERQILTRIADIMGRYQKYKDNEG